MPAVHTRREVVSIAYQRRPFALSEEALGIASKRESVILRLAPLHATRPTLTNCMVLRLQFLPLHPHSVSLPASASETTRNPSPAELFRLQAGHLAIFLFVSSQLPRRDGQSRSGTGVRPRSGRPCGMTKPPPCDYMVLVINEQQHFPTSNKANFIRSVQYLVKFDIDDDVDWTVLSQSTDRTRLELAASRLFIHTTTSS